MLNNQFVIISFIFLQFLANIYFYQKIVFLETQIAEKVDLKPEFVNPSILKESNFDAESD